MKPFYQDDPRACLELIMRLHPRLCLNGYDGPGLEEKRREMLEQHVESFYRSCVLLDSVAKTVTFNQRHTSYGLKHVLERAIGMYVANEKNVKIMSHILCAVSDAKRDTANSEW